MDSAWVLEVSQHLRPCLNLIPTRLYITVTDKKVSTIMSAFGMAGVRCCLYLRVRAGDVLIGRIGASLMGL